MVNDQSKAEVKKMTMSLEEREREMATKLTKAHQEKQKAEPAATTVKKDAPKKADDATELEQRLYDQERKSLEQSAREGATSNQGNAEYRSAKQEGPQLQYSSAELQNAYTKQYQSGAGPSTTTPYVDPVKKEHVISTVAGAMATEIKEKYTGKRKW